MAKHPHDTSRPEPAAVRRALEANDMEALKAALTPRQRGFAEEYVVDFNGTAAAIRAGYAVTYADRQAHLLMKHKGVSAYIDHLSRSKESKIVSVTPDYLIQRLTEIMNRPGVRTSDELRAIEMAMKHLGMFIDRTEISGPDGGAIALEQLVREEAENFQQQLEALRRRANDENAKKKDVTIV